MGRGPHPPDHPLTRQAPPGAILGHAAPPPPPPPPTGTPDPQFAYPADETFTEADWAELIGPERPGSELTYGCDGQAEDTLVGMIPAKKVQSARSFILGYAWADLAAPFALHRNLPAQHPDDPDLYAVSFSAKPCKPLAVPQTTPAYPSWLPGPPGPPPPPAGGSPPPPPPPPTPQVLQAWRPAAGTGFPSRQANYLTAEVLIRFHRPNWAMVSDAAAGTTPPAEWKRFMTRPAGEPRASSISLDGSGYQLKWAEGAPRIPGGPQIGNPYPGSLQLLSLTTGIRMRWVRVPLDYIQKNFVCTKIEECVNTLNQEWMFGDSRHRRVRPGDAEDERPQVRSVRLPGPDRPGGRVRAAVVRRERRPGMGLLRPEPAAGRDKAAAFGWDLYPFPGGQPANPGEDPTLSGGMGWYAANFTGVRGGPTLLEYTDHNQIFTGVRG